MNERDSEWIKGTRVRESEGETTRGREGTRRVREEGGMVGHGQMMMNKHQDLKRTEERMESREQTRRERRGRKGQTREEGGGGRGEAGVGRGGRRREDGGVGGECRKVGTRWTGERVQGSNEGARGRLMKYAVFVDSDEKKVNRLGFCD